MALYVQPNMYSMEWRSMLLVQLKCFRTKWAILVNHIIGEQTTIFYSILFCSTCLWLCFKYLYTARTWVLSFWDVSILMYSIVSYRWVWPVPPCPHISVFPMRGEWQDIAHASFLTRSTTFSNVFRPTYSYLCTYDLYSPKDNVLDACIRGQIGGGWDPTPSHSPK